MINYMKVYATETLTHVSIDDALVIIVKLSKVKSESLQKLLGGVL